MFGGTAGGDVMSVLVIISGLGALTGWTMICAEMPLAAANDGLFPERFKRLNKAGVPAFGIIASTALASIAMVINYLGSSGANAFTTLVLMTGITSAIPYGFSALAQIKWRRADQRLLKTPRFLRDMTVAIVALVFSVLFIFYSRNTGHSFWLYWAPFFLAAAAFALGIPVYNRQRGHMTEPEPVPPYRRPGEGPDPKLAAGRSPTAATRAARHETGCLRRCPGGGRDGRGGLWTPDPHRHDQSGHPGPRRGDSGGAATAIGQAGRPGRPGELCQAHDRQRGNADVLRARRRRSEGHGQLHLPQL